MKLNHVALLVAGILSASPAMAQVELYGVCTIVNGDKTQTYEVVSGGPEKLVLGYEGIDSGRYKITIANNEGTAWVSQAGSVQIGFSRDEAPVSNPPILCPTSPEELKKECEERNAAEHPPYVYAPTDRFHAKINDDGEADADFGPQVPGTQIDPDQFIAYKVVMPESGISEATPVLLQTPVAQLGGVRASCSVMAKRFF